MDNATLEASLAEAKKKAEEAGGKDETLNQAVKDAEKAFTDAQDPLKKELNKIDKKQFTRRERLNFEKKKIDEQLTKLDADEGVKPDDNTPVTVGMLKKKEQETALKTALDLAEDIEDTDERELTKHYLKDRVVPTGNAQEDLKFARAAVNSLRNAQLAEEAERKRNPQKFANSPGAPGKKGDVFTPTAEEAVFMRPPYNLSQADIIKARSETVSRVNQ